MLITCLVEIVEREGVLVGAAKLFVTLLFLEGGIKMHFLANLVFKAILSLRLHEWPQRMNV